MINLIQFANQAGASDLHISPNRQVYIRQKGALRPITKEKLSEEKIESLLMPLLTMAEKAALTQHHAVDFAQTITTAPKKTRVRGHYFRSQQGLTAVFRLISDEIVTLKSIHAPSILARLMRHKSGLILVTGATGSGKSTTLAAMIESINQGASPAITAITDQNIPPQKEAMKHIITIEDPIERIFIAHQALIEQRELHQHTHCFERALKDALRADPDIILIGELRDQASVHLALQAAETGHLVLATLHSNSATKAIDRIMSYFPHQHSQEIRHQLAESLNSVIAQQLITIDAKRVALFEVMTVNSAISNLIRENQLAQIQSNIETGKGFGMQTFHHHLEFLQKSGILSDLLAKQAQNLLNPEIYS